MGDAVLTPKGDKLYYQAAFESGYDLWEQKTKGKDEIPENLIEKMYGAITSFKEKLME